MTSFEYAEEDTLGLLSQHEDIDELHVRLWDDIAPFALRQSLDSLRPALRCITTVWFRQRVNKEMPSFRQLTKLLWQFFEHDGADNVPQQEVNTCIDGKSRGF